ncbi:MAG: hypothetical protein M1324_03515 [Patescibacteria group bacterium]|nr:hypothetical protein [Patescibacteria group bacterium]
MNARDFFELDAKQNSWAHAYLIIGQNDEKIKELTNYVIKQKKCLPADVSVVIPEDLSGKKGEIKIDQIKNLLHEINLSPAGNCRIAIIHNCEKLNQSSGNILLKTLEEPPKNVTFILLADNNSVLPTIKSRCRIILIPSTWENFDKDNATYASIIESNFFTASKEIEKIVKNNEIEPFLNALEWNFRNKMLNEKDHHFADSIHSIEKIRKDIQNNVNPRLALENLYLILET